jgi:uncharacterized protein (DUF488 family)
MLFTIGHGDREIQTFLDMLRAADARILVDVRRYPGSRRHPQLGRDALSAALRDAGIEYRWAGETLGGRRPLRPDSPHHALRNEGFRAYADHMDTRAFQIALEELLAEAGSASVAIMCAERHPSNCHRSLISDAVVARGVKVVHLLEPGRSCLATLHPCARVEGDRIRYDVQMQPSLDLGDT